MPPKADIPLLSAWLPPEGVHILLVLFLSFLIGLEREEHQRGTWGGPEEAAHTANPAGARAGRAALAQRSFGGVRTFPLIGLIGYTVAFLAHGELMPLTSGFAVIAAFLAISYWYKVSAGRIPGVTSEMAGLTTYLVGALVYYDDFWFATTLSVIAAFLLEMKRALEGLSRRIAPDDIFTFTKFLLLTAVILPILPDAAFTQFAINPYKTWLVVVAVSTVSYGSYVVQRWTKDVGGVLLAAVLGGAYSSTVATVVLAKKSVPANLPHLYAGGMLVASGVMYLRLALLLGIFNHALLRALGPAFLALSLAATLAGWLWSRRGDAPSRGAPQDLGAGNPLELGAAFLFAALFLAMLIATHWAVTHLGNTGVYTLAAIMGVSDVDPFIMGLTQSAGTSTAVSTAAAAIVIAAASNNIVKGAYAFYFAKGPTRVQSAALLVALAAAGLIPLLWI